MTHLMQLFKVSFLPILGREKDAKGNPEKVGRWMVMVTAPNMLAVDRVVEHFLPELHAEGCEIDDTVDVPSDHLAWSVSVGLPGRSRAFVVTAPSPDMAHDALLQAVEFDDRLTDYVAGKAYVARRIDMSREGVW
jgi:hypothetical protein